MGAGIDDNFYTFVAIRDDDSRPIVELRPCPNDAEALRLAAIWLDEHRSCVRAEIWRDAELIGNVAAGAETRRLQVQRSPSAPAI